MDLFFLFEDFFKRSLKGTKANNIKVQSNFFLSYFLHLVQLFLESMTAFIDTLSKKGGKCLGLNLFLIIFAMDYFVHVELHSS